MHRIIIGVLLGILSIAGSAHASNMHKLEMTLCDEFSVSETNNWNVELERYLTLRVADVKITPKHGYDFDIKLFFKADTQDLAQFDTPKKIEESVRRSTEEYLPYIVEKQIKLNSVPLPQSFGYYTVITDAKWANAQHVPPGEYKFMTRGMYRTSEDTALGFSIMTNDVTSKEYNELLTYIYNFVKNASNQPIKPTQKTCAAYR
ncbi:MAG: hypothetical protein ABW076_18715 [Candidatus Thiodiazotropha sp.]